MKKKLSFYYTFSVFILFLSCQSKSEHLDKLDNVITKHFEAIKNRNIDNLLKTVDEKNISLILPSGTYSKTFENYKKVNSDWFNDKNWDIDYEIIEKIIEKRTGIILTKITYNYLDDNNKNTYFQYYLTLIFHRNNNDEWKLIFDQNTLIK